MKVLVSELPTIVLPNCVLSVVEGVLSPSIIETLYPCTFISGEGFNFCAGETTEPVNTGKLNAVAAFVVPNNA